MAKAKRTKKGKKTEPLLNFLVEDARLLYFTQFIIDSASEVDEMTRRAARVLSELATNEREKKEAKKLEKEGKGAMKEFKKHAQLIFQLILCRTVDNFLTYLTGLITLIFMKTPKMLKIFGKKKIDINTVLEHKDINTLISRIIESKVNELSYLGMEKLFQHLSKNLGFRLFEKKKSLERAISIIEVRNLIVHNRAIANQYFLDRNKNFKVALGEQVKLDVKYVYGETQFLMDSVLDIDKRAIKKFRL